MSGLAHAGAVGGGRTGIEAARAMDSHDTIIPGVREGTGIRLVSPELVGRDAELGTIAQLIGSATAGSGATLLLSGEAGMGKTALLARAREVARHSGLRVLRGECVRFEMARAFGPLVDALRTVGDHPAAETALAVAPASDGPRPSAAGESDRYAAHTAFVRAFAALAEERPLLLAIDDLHWADESTLELFAHLSRRLARGVLLVGTYRPEEVGRRPALRRAIGDLPRDRTWDLSLRRLTASEVGRVLRLILGQGTRISVETREVLQARSAGNPLFLEETLRALAQRGELQHGDGGWRLGPIRDVPLPASVQEAVRERFVILDPVARDVILIAATVGERFDLELVGRASHAPESAVIAAVHNAIAGQLVIEAEGEDGDRFAFRHPVIRDAILEEVLRVERRALHRRVAEVLERDPPFDAGLSALAYHWDEAHDRDRAFRYRREAGEQEARRFAHAEALVQFERALELAPNDDRTVADLHMRAAAMARVLARSGADLRHATAAARRLEHSKDRRAFGLALLTMQAAARGMLWPRTRRRELIQRAFTALEPLGETPELARACTASALDHALDAAMHPVRSRDQMLEALAAAERGAAIAERCAGDRAGAYSGLAVVHMVREDPEGAITALRSAVAAYDDEGIAAPWQISNMSILADLVERNGVTTGEVRSLRERADRLRERYGVMQTYMARLHTLLLAGEWDEFIRVHEDHADAEDESASSVAHHALHRAFVEVARKGPSALPPARAAHEAVLRSEDVSETDAAAVPEVALLVGDHVWALEATERAAELVSHPHPYGPFITFAGVYGVLAAREARDEAAAAKWLARFPTGVSPTAVSFNIRVVEHTVRYGALERAWTDGDRDRAIDALATLVDERAASADNAGHTTLPGFGIWPLLTYFLALREVDVRVQRGRRDDQDRAAARLAWVVEFYRKCKATWYLERLRERAAAWGVAFPADAPVVAAGVPRLTGREREIALLVAKGMTNRQISQHLTLSVRTAESHVERIRSKLGFRTRAQVAVWAAETYGAPN